MASHNAGRPSREEVLAALNVERFYAARVKGPLKREGPKRLKALCPFHNDTDPSLSIEPATGLFKCFGCGASGSVFDFQMRLRNVDFPTALENLAREAGLSDTATAQKADPEVTYDYRDEDGTLLYQTRRIGHGKGKKLWQRRPDGEGGWINDIKGVRRALYRLPELIAAPDEIVWSPEGEKDCDTLLHRGMLATTSVCGAKAPWTADYAETLRGRTVRILPDNDDEGRQHAEHKARMLHGIAASMKIVELAGLPHKGDITDWFEAGHTIEELEALAEATPEWQPNTDGSTAQAADDGQDKQKPSQADRLVRLVLAEGVQLFHDPLGDAFARVRVHNHWETLRCRNKHFRHWLAGAFYRVESKVPNSDALSSALTVLEAQARFDGKEYELHNRVAWHEGAIWYDLSGAEWRAVRITAEGWEVVAEPPILFRRHVHQRPQVMPVTGGDLRDLVGFVNLREESQQVLVLVYVVACLIPDMPHPIPVLHGGHGAAKTTLERLLRRLVDPSATEVLSLPRDATEMVQQLSHHWAPFYDNVGDLPDWVSDVFCRASTGEGFTKRELWSDDEDVIYQFRRCVGLNGINVAAHKSDLLDRCILLGLEPIPDKDRRSEKELWMAFEEARPRLLGAAFDALSRAMKLRPGVRLTGLPRMADFALWGCAVAEALGFTQDEFLAAYDQNAEARNDEVLQGTPVAAAVAALMEQRDTWEGIPTELYGELEAEAQALKVNLRSRTWPKAPNALMRKLNEVRANLAAVGIEVRTDREGRQRRVIIRKSGENSVISVTSVTEAASTHDSDPESDDAIAEGIEIASPIASRENTPSHAQNGADDGNDAHDAILPDQSEADDNMPAVPVAALRQPCFTCGGREFWHDAYSNPKCRTCHPPANEGMVAQTPET